MIEGVVVSGRHVVQGGNVSTRRFRPVSFHRVLIMVKILPLAILSVNWPEYIKLCEETLGFSPTRGLDEARLDIKSPAAYLATLDLENKPLEQLGSGRYTSNSFDQMFFAFILQADDFLLMEIYKECSRLKILSKRGKRQNLVIISGTMSEWHDNIIACHNERVSTEIREVANRCLDIFEQSGFKEVWSRWRRVMLKDSTFILVAS